MISHLISVDNNNKNEHEIIVTESPENEQNHISPTPVRKRTVRNKN